MDDHAQWQKRSDYLQITVPACRITLERRPWYCDRGNFVAKVFPTPGSALDGDFDGQDAFPRYYFDEERAKLEVVAWLAKRRLL